MTNTQTSFNFDKVALADEIFLSIGEERQPAARMRVGRKHEKAQGVARDNSGLSLENKVFQNMGGKKFGECVRAVHRGTASPKLERAVRLVIAQKISKSEQMKLENYFLSHAAYTLGMAK